LFSCDSNAYVQKKPVGVFSILAALVLAVTISSSITVVSVSAQQQNSTSTSQTSSNATGGRPNMTGGIQASLVPGASTLADKAFSPNPINVKVGDSVTWTNKDTIAHTVTSGTGPSDPNKGKVFDSGLSTLLTQGKTFSHKFNTAGEFPYFCQIHPTMVGKVVVS
jgi:plastocyanin